MEERTEQRPGERFLLWFILGFSLFALIMALMIPHLDHLNSAGVFPIFITSIMIISAIRILWKNRKRYAVLSIAEEVSQAQSFAVPKIVAGYTVILLLYILFTAPLHFLPSSYLFLVGSFLFLKGASLWKSFLIAAFMLAIIFVLFQTIFKVILW